MVADWLFLEYILLAFGFFSAEFVQKHKQRIITDLLGKLKSQAIYFRVWNQ